MMLTDYLQRALRRVAPKRFYCEDALITTHNHLFVDDPSFLKAYGRGVEAAQGLDRHNRWRINVALWLAGRCAEIEGDFVECGVNFGITSSAIMERFAWDKVGKRFWLIDSFAGLDKKQLTEKEKGTDFTQGFLKAKKTGFYTVDVEACRRNFSQWKNAIVLQGWVPQCLDQVTSEKIAFLHLDMNSSMPEIAALKYFFGKLARGAFVLLDDYGYSGGGALHHEWNNAANQMGIDILSLPTGQGLIHFPKGR